MNLTQARNQLMQSPEFREEYYKPDDLGMEFKIIRKIKGLTQKQVAQMTGTKQEAISRFENGDFMPSLTFLHKITRALGYYLKVEFKKDSFIR